MSTETNEKKCCHSNRNHWMLTILFCVIFAFIGYFAGKINVCDKSKRCSPQYFQGNHGGNWEGKCSKQKKSCHKKIEGEQEEKASTEEE